MSYSTPTFWQPYLKLTRKGEQNEKAQEQREGANASLPPFPHVAFRSNTFKEVPQDLDHRNDRRMLYKRLNTRATFSRFWKSD